MIWYRHWLELRWGWLYLGILWAGFVIPVGGPFNSLRWDVWYALPLVPFGPELIETPLGRSIGPAVEVWAEFAGRILPAVFMAGMVLAGNTIVNFIHYPARGSSYTLTLPVSRVRLVVTRYIAALGLSIATGAVVTLAGVLAFHLMGTPAPLGPVAGSFALGVLALASSVAVLSASQTLFGLWASIPVYLVLFLLSSAEVSYLVAAPARGEAPWGSIAGHVAVIVAATAVTVRRTTRKEY